MQEKQDYITLGQQVWKWGGREKTGVPPPWSTVGVKIEEEEVELSEEEVF